MEQKDEDGGTGKGELEVDDSTDVSVSAKVPVRLWSVFYSVLTTSLLSLLVGATLVFSSPVLVELTQLEDPEFRFNTLLSELFVAASLVGGILGGPFGGWVADRFGRKTSIILNSAPYLFGYFIILCSHLARTSVVFKVLLILGRFISGIGMGWTYVMAGVYIGELSPAQFRGIFASSSELSLTFGVLFLLALGSIPGIHYYDLALVMVGIVALFICMAPWIPETPRWLLMHSKDQRQAVAVMRCLRGPKYPKINTELEEIKSTIPMSHPSLFQVMRQLLCNRGTLVPFLLLLFVYVYQPASGAAAVYAYVGPIFLEAGVPFPNLTATFSFGGVNVLVTFVSVFLIELIGRKFLLAVSSAGMFAASLLLGTYFYVTRPSPCNNSTLLETSTESLDSCHPHLYPLAILGFIIFAVSFALGLAPVPWVLLSEYLPLSVRGVAGGVTIAASRSMAAVVTGTFLSFSETLGAWTLWWTLTCVNFVAFLMIVLLVKETKGKELEEVQELFVARTCQPTCSAITCKRTCQWCYS